jgi:hypothetical protein
VANFTKVRGATTQISVSMGAGPLMSRNDFLSRRKFILSCGAVAASVSGCAVEQYMPWNREPEIPEPMADANTVRCVRAETGICMDPNPNDAFWRGAQPVYIERDRYGTVVPGYHSAVYTRWTERNLYVLFVCPYEELHLHPDPKTRTETWELWNWDVAEAFIGWDFDKIEAYKEFEMSPQDEYIDLDIDLTSPTRGLGMQWSSGYDVAAHIDKGKKIWNGMMKIPFPAVLPPDKPAPAVGAKLRVNFFRCQGPEKKRVMMAWQPPMAETFHKPAQFGTMVLVESK